jgi:hypothetical protein
MTDRLADRIEYAIFCTLLLEEPRRVLQVLLKKLFTLRSQGADLCRFYR